MSFQDKLKSSFKTKDKVANEQAIEDRRFDLMYVDKILQEVEREILKKADGGEYEVVNGKQAIKCLYSIEASGGYIDRIKCGGKNSDKVKFEFNNRHDFFMEELKDRLDKDNISITSEYLANFIPRKPVAQWPKLAKGAAVSMATFGKIVIECQTAIPADYSEEFIASEQAQALMEIEEARTAEEEQKVEEIDEVEIYEMSQQSTVDFDDMEGHQFEAFCAEVLSKNGFMHVEQTRSSGDQGIDILAFKDGVKFGIQCKRYSSDVGNRAVQEVFAGKSYYHCHVAVILTNSYFTQFARKLAQLNNVVLWDRDKLLEFIENAGD